MDKLRRNIASLKNDLSETRRERDRAILGYKIQISHIKSRIFLAKRGIVLIDDQDSYYFSDIIRGTNLLNNDIMAAMEYLNEHPR